MKTEGKLNNNKLGRILGDLPKFRDDILIGPGVGEDCAAILIDPKSNQKTAILLTTDPITASSSNQGELAVRVCLNDIASSGARATALLVTIIAPLETTIEQISEISRQAGITAKKAGAQIIGGHTERSSSVNQIIVSATAIASMPADKVVATSGASAGDVIFMTKSAGIEGTYIMLQSLSGEDQYAQHLDRYRDFTDATEDGVLGAVCNASAMHDVTEGGILGAVQELCAASGVGCEIFEDQIPVSNITQQLCSKYSMNPLRLIGSGSMLIAVPANDAENIESRFKESGIAITKIGICKSEKDRVLVGPDASRKTLDIADSSRDEIYKFPEADMDLEEQKTSESDIIQ